MDQQLPHKPRIMGDFPRVYPIIDTAHLEAVGVGVVDYARGIAEAGMRIAQYRHKGAFTRSRYEEAAEVGAVLRASGACYIVNDRADIAMALGADGVHVGQEDLPVRLVRRLVGDSMIVGFSTHGAAQLASPECRSADYLAIGPVFGTVSKRNPDPVVGPEGVRLARALTPKPLVGIGGIDLSNALDVFASGADCVSVISSARLANLGRWAALERQGPSREPRSASRMGILAEDGCPPPPGST